MLLEAMSTSKLHHYVPQFHLKRFLNQEGKLRVRDKIEDTTFATTPGRIAAETKFYYLSELAERGHDPLIMERQFSDLEHQVSMITTQWLEWLREIDHGAQIDISAVNRELVSLHIALQFLRTADTRDTLALLSAAPEEHGSLSENDQRRLHASLLWDESVFNPIAERICRGIWVFGRNLTSIPFPFTQGEKVEPGHRAPAFRCQP